MIKIEVKDSSEGEEFAKVTAVLLTQTNVYSGRRG